MPGSTICGPGVWVCDPAVSRGPHFLQAGPGDSGLCQERDVSAEGDEELARAVLHPLPACPYSDSLVQSCGVQGSEQTAAGGTRAGTLQSSLPESTGDGHWSHSHLRGNVSLW